MEYIEKNVKCRKNSTDLKGNKRWKLIKNMGKTQTMLITS